jgi:hypothetical protein
MYLTFRIASKTYFSRILFKTYYGHLEVAHVFKISTSYFWVQKTLSARVYLFSSKLTQYVSVGLRQVIKESGERWPEQSGMHACGEFDTIPHVVREALMAPQRSPLAIPCILQKQPH